MPWFVVDDNAHSHPKMIAAGNAALGLWLRAGAYAAQHLTDGIVPGVIAKMYGSKPQIAKLLAAGLWHEHGHTCPHPKCRQPQPGDYYIHDYLAPYNPSRAEVVRKRERAAEKKRRQRGVQDPLPDRGGFDDDPRENRGGYDDDPPTNHAPDDEESAGHGAASSGDSRGTHAPANPSPPLPSHQGGAESAPPAGSRRGREPLSLIPADWQPSDDDVAAAQLARSDTGREQLTPQQLAAVTRKFVQRMLDDQVRAAAWGGRWQQWAENERPAAPAGADVIPFDRRTPPADLFGAALQRAQTRMTQEGGSR
ncbi:hypothetical protein OG529_04225 [Streptomyces longwoodensis]|uniref:hypothetical protein n=1 Tax=Streptomyces longwoodensis TaxID=68231 RepID=UPI00324A838D